MLVAICIRGKAALRTPPPPYPGPLLPQVFSVILFRTRLRKGYRNSVSFSEDRARALLPVQRSPTCLREPPRECLQVCCVPSSSSPCVMGWVSGPSPSFCTIMEKAVSSDEELTVKRNGSDEIQVQDQV